MGKSEVVEKEAESKKQEAVEDKQEVPWLPKDVWEQVKPKFYEIKDEATRQTERANLLEKRLLAIEEKEKAESEKKMKEEGKLKELLEVKEKEIKEKENLLKSTMINNELRIEAIKGGMKDLDGLKMLNSDDLVKILFEGGMVRGADEVIKSLKEKKPYLFGTVESGSFVNVDTSRPSVNASMKHVEGKAIYTREQIKDPVFYEKNRADILRAQIEGRIK